MAMQLKLGFCFVAGAAALALAGCGKPAPSTQGAIPDVKPKTMAAAPDACAVLTKAIADKYLGATATLKQDTHPNPKMSLCQYTSDHGAITVMSGPWDMVYTKAASGDTSVAGLGDEAHISAMGLYVRKGDHGLDVGVMTGSGEFWGKAADDEMARTAAAEQKVATDLVAND